MSTTATRYVKCLCRHCSGSIEFEIVNVGEAVQCPHCGLETQLFIPPPLKSVRTVPKKRRNYRPWVIGGTVVLAIVGFAWFIYGLVTSPKVQEVAAQLGIVGGGVIMMIVAVFVFLWALLWILFPVFVYFSLNRLEKLLIAIEANTRRK